jgi:hypothetical protein
MGCHCVEALDRRRPCVLLCWQTKEFAAALGRNHTPCAPFRHANDHILRAIAEQRPDRDWVAGPTLATTASYPANSIPWLAEISRISGAPHPKYPVGAYGHWCRGATEVLAEGPIGPCTERRATECEHFLSMSLAGKNVISRRMQIGDSGQKPISSWQTSEPTPMSAIGARAGCTHTGRSCRVLRTLLRQSGYDPV